MIADLILIVDLILNLIAAWIADGLAAVRARLRRLA